MAVGKEMSAGEDLLRYDDLRNFNLPAIGAVGALARCATARVRSGLDRTGAILCVHAKPGGILICRTGRYFRLFPAGLGDALLGGDYLFGNDHVLFTVCFSLVARNDGVWLTLTGNELVLDSHFPRGKAGHGKWLFNNSTRTHTLMTNTRDSTRRLNKVGSPWSTETISNLQTVATASRAAQQGWL